MKWYSNYFQFCWFFAFWMGFFFLLWFESGCIWFYGQSSYNIHDMTTWLYIYIVILIHIPGVFFICQLHNWSKNLFIFMGAYVKHKFALEKLFEVGSFSFKSNGNIVSIAVASPFFSGKWKWELIKHRPD